MLDPDAILAVATDSYDPPESRCELVSSPIVLDGKVDESAWEKAQRLSFYDVVTGGPALCGQSEARLLWDDSYLYVAVVATDRNIWATLKNRDDTLCCEEVIEVFIDPDGDLEHYVEIEINPLNTVFDLKHDRTQPAGLQQDAEWNGLGLRNAVHIAGTLNDYTDVDTFWSVEIAIPWTCLGDLPEKTAIPPCRGDVWRVNLYRYERPRGKDHPHSPVEHTAWSPTRKVNFHRPEWFGRVKFCGSPSSLRSQEVGQ